MQVSPKIQRYRMGGLARLMNRRYYLCIEERYAAAVMQEWIKQYKPVALNFRNANEKKGVYGCFVLGIQDEDGLHLDFIERIARLTNAKIEVI